MNKLNRGNTMMSAKNINGKTFNAFSGNENR